MVEVDVWRKDKLRCFEKGRRQVTKSFFNSRRDSGFYDYVHEYAGSHYGTSLRLRMPDSVKMAIWDYPGEYPECVEVRNKSWLGILVLPPNRAKLIGRLIHSQRASRCRSATREFDECMRELKRSCYSDSHWVLYRSRSQLSLVNFCKGLVKEF